MKFSIKQVIKQGTEEGEEGISGNVKQFDFCEFRERDWSNVLTCHEKSTLPYLWQTSNHSISKLLIEAPTSLTQRTHLRVSSVAVSLCGNFGVLGYETGLIQKINMQSGKDRGTFVSKLLPQADILN